LEACSTRRSILRSDLYLLLRSFCPYDSVNEIFLVGLLIQNTLFGHTN